MHQYTFSVKDETLGFSAAAGPSLRAFWCPIWCGIAVDLVFGTCDREGVLEWIQRRFSWIDLFVKIFRRREVWFFFGRVEILGAEGSGLWWF